MPIMRIASRPHQFGSARRERRGFDVGMDNASSAMECAETDSPTFADVIFPPRLLRSSQHAAFEQQWQKIVAVLACFPATPRTGQLDLRARWPKRIFRASSCALGSF